MRVRPKIKADKETSEKHPMQKEPAWTTESPFWTKCLRLAKALPGCSAYSTGVRGTQDNNGEAVQTVWVSFHGSKNHGHASSTSVFFSHLDFCLRPLLPSAIPRQHSLLYFRVQRGQLEKLFLLLPRPISSLFLRAATAYISIVHQVRRRAVRNSRIYQRTPR